MREKKRNKSFTKKRGYEMFRIRSLDEIHGEIWKKLNEIKKEGWIKRKL